MDKPNLSEIELAYLAYHYAASNEKVRAEDPVYAQFEKQMKEKIEAAPGGWEAFDNFIDSATD